MIITGMCSELTGGMLVVECWLRHLVVDFVSALITRGGDLVSYNVLMFEAIRVEEER